MSREYPTLGEFFGPGAERADAEADTEISEADEVAASLQNGAPPFDSLDEAIAYVRKLMLSGESEVVISNVGQALWHLQCAPRRHAVDLDAEPEYLTVVLQARGMLIQDETGLEITTAEYKEVAAQIQALIAARGET